MASFFKLIFFLSFCMLCSCNNQAQQTTVAVDTTTVVADIDVSIAGSFNTEENIFLDSNQIESFFLQFPKFKSLQESTRRFYRGRKYAFAWFDKDGITEQANHLYNRVTDLKKDGLPDSTLYQTVLTGMMASSSTENNTTFTELMLTAQYFTYSNRTYKGLSEQQIRGIDWFLPRKKITPDKLLDSLLSNNPKNIFSGEPVFRQYNLLKQQLAQLQNAAANNNDVFIGWDKKNYIPGDSSQVLLTVRNRLVQLGDIVANNSAAIFDESLKAGILQFQKRHGLKEDAVMGASFFAELNVPLGEREKQIMLNMERFRWIPEKMEGKYLVVNIPEFKLRAYNNDSLVWSMNVVVGQELRKTVIFNGVISFLVFSPYWNIPSGILKRDVLPAMARNKNYLANKNMEITGYNGKTPSVRQRPGPDNPLGQVKFMFPNVYDIYLHDSPSKSYFEKEQRAFSSGCVRLSDAKKLAGYILKTQPEWTEEKITRAMKAGKEQYVNLKQKMSVFITYFTAWVDNDGKMNFRKDIYGRDKKLTTMLFTNAAK
jgi:murein L,D-transpeptidase YcbB/YkuD